CFGNIVGNMALEPEEQKEFKTPFAVMRQLLWIFKTGSEADFAKVEALLAPSLSSEEKSANKEHFDKSFAKKEILRKIDKYKVLGYFLDKNCCVVFYQTPNWEKFSHLAFSAIFFYENGRWYMGDNLTGHISSNFAKLSHEMSSKSAKGKALDINVSKTLSPAQKESLLSDKEAVNFYEKLSPIYGLPQIPKN
ncbi:MAG: hypothetical protein IKO42_02565, partial [Opitutales bacterium]|nr:hypothetical protein [Opitutales bacterium]